MTKRKLVTLSMQPEDLELLNAIAEEVDLTKSELVRRMLYKISFDDKNKAIIKRGNVIAFYNAHSVNEPKKADIIEQKNNPGDQSGEDSSSLDPTENIPAEVLNYNWLKD